MLSKRLTFTVHVGVDQCDEKVTGMWPYDRVNECQGKGIGFFFVTPCVSGVILKTLQDCDPMSE
jgi:hypothetical protein